MSATGTAPTSSLASVVSIPEGLEQWRLCDDKLLGKLHAKCWGKSMAEEEEAWRAEQQSTSGPGDNNQSEDESEDDDIISGCYVLDFDTGYSIRRLWVRVSVFTLGEISMAFANLIGRIHPDL